MQDQKDPLKEDVPVLKDSGSLVPLESQHLPVPVRRKSRRSWRAVAALLIVLLGAAGGGGYYVWRRMHPPLPVGISYGNGRIEADEVDIDTKYAGRVAQLLVDIGDLVTPGQVVARMDTRDIEQSLSKSEAQAQQAQHAIDEAKANLVQQQTQQTLAAQEIDRTKHLIKSGWATKELLDQRQQQLDAALNLDGFRVVAVAYKEMDPSRTTYSIKDEADLTLLGYIAFLDPPKESAREAIAALARKGVLVKVLTGDNEIITRKICREVDLDPGEILTGSKIPALSDTELADLADRTTVLSKIDAGAEGARRARPPRQGTRGRIPRRRYQRQSCPEGGGRGNFRRYRGRHCQGVGRYHPAQKSLLVLQEGVTEGRKVFANITKYIKMGASSNFGNMFSVLGASLFLPFLPMAPIQVLTNNLLYDFSQTAIPTDNVDEEYLASPRRWDIGNIFKFMVFIGPISSIFDYATYGMMLFVFNAWANPSLFQTGWFVESLLTQTLIIHIIRTAKIPFIQSHASPALITTTMIICLIGIALPFSWAGSALGFVPLPWTYWPLVASMLLAYASLTHLVKVWFTRKWGI